jgi:hemerythrin-like domain-containing protein
MGFKFPDFIDYSYSSIRNTNQRLAGMFTELEKLLQLPLSFFVDHHTKHIDMYEHNFYNVIDKNFDSRNMNTTIDQFDRKINGKL